MIKRVHDGGECLFEIEKINDETRVRIDRPIKLNFNPIRMTVEPSAAVRFGDARQKVRRLELECLRYLHSVLEDFPGLRTSYPKAGYRIWDMPTGRRAPDEETLREGFVFA